ncbi:MAG: hypothetical protein A2W03_17170 [Candidatus Aminicenantes bacterium RBG_16_63_16]|nr:MAG: hypothetical protein A2W03_17170 [Candidatus Aminicenantes bacterium RBG_16_63_16]
MNIGILGTGIVGRSHAAKLVALEHRVVIGTREVARTLAVDRPDAMGNPSFSDWQKEHPGMEIGTFAEAAAHGEVAINAIHGAATVETLQKVERGLEGKILIESPNAVLQFQGRQLRPAGRAQLPQFAEGLSRRKGALAF